MGTVHLARSRGGRAVAVKVARPELAADPAFRERFRAEVAAARKVGGFHTAPVVDADPDADPPWLATAYVPGPTLSALLTAQGPMDGSRLRRLGAALAEALLAVHACGLVHRDLKPGNIIMAEDGPRVLDFGIARAVESTRLTATGTAFGTPGYLAPEQALGEEVTGAADVFALGAVLVAAAGGRAFGDGTPMGLMYRSVHEAADVSAVPAGVREVVAACLSKSPADRPTPDELLDVFAPAAPTAVPEPARSATVVSEPVDGVPPDGPQEQGHEQAAAQAPAQGPEQGPKRGPEPADRVPTALVPPGPGGPADRVPVAYAPTVTAAPAPPAYAPAVPPPHAPRPSTGQPAAEGPSFVLADRSASVVADTSGIELTLDGVQADFLWNEIGQVEYDASKRGTRFTLTVTLYDGKAYTCTVAVRRSTGLDQLTAQLDLVLSRFLTGTEDDRRG
ncbi:serine/threonine-protein kinase [Streptomyces sp. NPDC002889]|uniref:serine/threonine-protein kinase n=1 Tax=Streptomyces sp. NPDC002889 TaxID=3364669 RepID=UPI003683E6AF